MASKSGFSVLSWNINGLKTRLEKNDNLQEKFADYDVVLLQETHIGGKDLDKITETFKAYCDVKLMTDLNCTGYEKKKNTMYLTSFDSSSKGVSILINKPHKQLKAFCEGGDFAWINVEIDGQKYTFVSVYYHSSDDDLICDLMLKLFYSFYTQKLDLDKCRPVIGGDFNTTLSNLDVKGKNKAHGPRRNRLNEFIRIMHLSDVWREKNEGEPGYTCPRREPKSRLDYIFMSKRDMGCVKSCEICDDLHLSDHLPLILTLKKENDVEELSLNFEQANLN